MKECEFTYIKKQRFDRYRLFLLTWSASQYANLSEQKKAFAKEKGLTPIGLVWDTNMAAVSLFLGHQYGRRDVM